MAEQLKPCNANELWVAAPGFEDRYDVSDQGRLRCWFTGGGHRLKTPRLKDIQRDKDGYSFAILYDASRNKMKGFRLSRLVLLAFKGNPPSLKHEASHLDGDKRNNFLGNLAWETRQENEDRKEVHGTRPKGETNSQAKLNESKVREIRMRRSAGEKLQELADEFGVSISTISYIAKGKTWKKTA